MLRSAESTATNGSTLELFVWFSAGLDPLFDYKLPRQASVGTKEFTRLWSLSGHGRTNAPISLSQPIVNNTLRRSIQ